MIQAGDRVKVRLLGEAEVLRVLGGKALVHLLPPVDVQIRVDIGSLELLEEPSGSPSGAPVPAARPPTRRVEPKPRLPREEAEQLRADVAVTPPRAEQHAPAPRTIELTQLSGRAPARRAIEALRFGVVPSAALRRLTLGYEELTEWVVSRLPSTGQQLTVSDICGPFGMGKSHSMAVVRQVAAEQGFAVARAEIDGRQVTLADPQRLLHRLFSAFEAGNGRASSQS